MTPEAPMRKKRSWSHPKSPWGEKHRDKSRFEQKNVPLKAHERCPGFDKRKVKDPQNGKTRPLERPGDDGQ